MGGNKLESVDIRFICATNRNPLDDVKNGKFEKIFIIDCMFYPYNCQTLRERGNDIIEIATSFLIEYAQEEQKAFVSFSEEVKELFMHQYDWPGNVRQLQNIIRNIVVLHNDTIVNLTHLPAPLNTLAAVNNSNNNNVNTISINNEITLHDSDNLILPLADVERNTIENAITFCNGNIPKAAALLDVSPSTIYRKKQAWE